MKSGVQQIGDATRISFLLEGVANDVNVLIVLLFRIEFFDDLYVIGI